MDKYPAEVLAVSHSSIKTWRFCQYAYHYKYTENLEPRRKAKQLVRGTIIHAMIEAHIKGEDWQAEWKRQTASYDQLFKEEKEKYGDLPGETFRIVKRYISRWEKLDPLEYLLCEAELGPLPLTSHTIFKFKIDGLAVDKRGRRWLVEHKTHERFPSEEQRLCDLQSMLYVWGVRASGHLVDGVLWDYIRTKPPAVPDQLKNGTLSKRKNIDTDYATYLAAIKSIDGDPKDYREILDIVKERGKNNFYRRHYIPAQGKLIEYLVEDTQKVSLEMYHLRDMPTRNFSQRTCPFCDYRHLCELEVRGMDSCETKRALYQQRKRDKPNAPESEA